MKLCAGSVVRISDEIEHDLVYRGQTGVVFKYIGDLYGEPYYYVVVYDSKSFWACGFNESELQPLGFEFQDMIEAYAHWLSTDCWNNTSRKYFNKFMKALKIIRKEYKTIVRNRI